MDPGNGIGGDASAAQSPDGVPVANAGLKRNAESASDTASPDGALAAKKKKMGPGSRGVANLTPDQLAKKRANDREAQRAIRERTKNQMETLERRIVELTNQKPYQELQAVLIAKEAVEQENRQIKQRLASIVELMQTIIGPAAAEQAYISPQDPCAAQTGYHQQATARAANALTPTDVASPAGSLESHRPYQAWQPGQNGHPSSEAVYESRHGTRSGSVGSTSSDQPTVHLAQQRLALRHGLDMGPERLELNFVLQPNQRLNRIQNGLHGAQDSPQFHHVPMKHDWTAVRNEEPLQARSGASDSPGRLEAQMTNHMGGRRNDIPTAVSLANDYGREDDPGLTYANAGSEPALPARYSMPVQNCEPTCPLDALLLDFLSERRQRAADGLPAHEVVGPRYPSVSSLLNPANSVHSHPLSKFFTDILSTFPDISTLPERVAVLYIMFLIMRWQVSPTRENYERLPPWARPLESQIHRSHPAWIDHLPFPLMREKLVNNYNPTEYLLDNFFIPYTTTLTLSWPYEQTDTLLQSPDSDEVMINPVFERHLRNLDNWKLGDAFVRAFPGLVGTCGITQGPGRTTGGASTSTPRPNTSSSSNSR